MKKVALHFVGANGFPAALYRPVMARVATCIADATGGAGTVSSATTDVFPHVHVGKDWTQMIEAIIADVEARNEGPVTAIGHSLGGALLGGAATARPDLFRAIIAVDSPLFNPAARVLFSAMYMLPKKLVYQYHPMIAMAKKKPDHWASKAEAEEYFRSKRLFSKMHPEVFRIFVDECIVPNSSNSSSSSSSISSGSGVKLLFSTDTEAEIYYQQPVDMPGHPRKNQRLLHFDTPATFMYSDAHEFISKRDVAWIDHSVKSMKTAPYSGGHFWPLHQPDEFAAYLSKLIVNHH
jgi:pimeloyl-ACP methyl ester carboxylesterase